MPLLNTAPHRLRSVIGKGPALHVLTVSKVSVRGYDKITRRDVDWLVTRRFAQDDETAHLLPIKSDPRGRRRWDEVAAETAISRGVALYDATAAGKITSRIWFFAGAAYTTDDAQLTAEDAKALANERANRRRLQLEKAHAVQAMTANLDKRPRREPIPQDVKIAVWQRDGGRCVECGEQRDLEFDHIIPLAMGGANTMRNLQLLCGTCNRRKGASLG